MKEKKRIEHRILDRHTVWGMILLTVLALVLVQLIIGGILGGLAGFILANLTGISSISVMYIAFAIAAFIMLAIHKRWFYPEFKGNIIGGKDFGRFMLITVIILLAVILPDIVVMLSTGAKYAFPSITSLLTALMAGTTEEVIFRGVPVSYAMRQYKEANKIPFVVLLSSILFSLFHLSNIFVGAALSSTILQLVTSLGMGCMLCAIYLRSGSIIPPMMLHFLYDVYALMNAGSVTETGVMEAAVSNRDIISNLILFVIEIMITCILLRKSVWEEVMSTWNQKWNR